MNYKSEELKSKLVELIVNGNITVKDLSTVTELDEKTVSNFLSELIAEGKVERVKTPTVERYVINV